MAVNTMIKEKPAITPERIAAAKERAIDLCAQAYGLHDIPQPDGSTLRLCWHGRILRSIDLMGEARAAGDSEKVAKMQPIINGMREKYNGIAKQAEQAASDWSALAAAFGADFDPLEVYPPDCECEQCRKQRAMGMYRMAVVKAREAVEAFLCPGVEVPPVVTLTESAADAKSRDAIYRHLVGIARAFREYEVTARDAGVTVDWRELL